MELIWWLKVIVIAGMNCDLSWRALIRLKQGTYTLGQKTQKAYELKDVQWDIRRGAGGAVWGGRFLLWCRASAGAKILTCFGACRSALSCIWLVPIKTKTYLYYVLILLELSSSSEGISFVHEKYRK